MGDPLIFKMRSVADLLYKSIHTNDIQ